MSLEQNMPLLALAVSVLFVICSFSPLLAPLTDSSLVFVSGDFKTIAGSGILRAYQTSQVISKGNIAIEDLRFFVLGSLGRLADVIEFSDSQFHSILILLSTLIGSAGIFWLVSQRVKDGIAAAGLIVILVVLYFLNPWSIVRIGHFWIWITYAVLPMQLALGLRYVEGGSFRHLGAYSLLVGAFGPIPHSLIYMLCVHAAAAAYGAIRKERKLLTFIAVPLVLYALINAPFIAMMASDPGDSVSSYPADTSDYVLGILSRNGELANLLAFSNYWWPPIGEETIDLTANPMFSFTSVMLFAAVFLVFAVAYLRMDGCARVMCLVFIFAILVAMFISQGMNNGILERLVGLVTDSGLRDLIGPFREWARMSIIIPVFMAGLLSFSVPALRRQKEAVLALGVLALVSLAASPSWDYLHEAYAAVYLPDVFHELASAIPYDARIAWMKEGEHIMPATTVTGVERMTSWPGTQAIGSRQDAEKFRQAFLQGNMSREQMEMMATRYVVLRPEREAPYPWLSCEVDEHLELCSTGVPLRRFKAYDSIADAGIAESDGARVLQYSRIDNSRWVVRVDAAGPFLLTFAEDYLPEWEARYGTGETAKAVRIGNITGFWIEEGGELGILVVYRPQESFESMMPLSTAGIVACLVMIVGGRR